MMSLVTLFLFAISIAASSLQCTEQGFRQYLQAYSFKYGDSMDNYVKSRLPIFLKNCHSFEKQRSSKYKPEITLFMDWTDDEINQLGDLSVRYSGITYVYDEIRVNTNEYSQPIRDSDYCYDSLRDYSRTTQICSTSWATSIIEIADIITGKHFSVDQLLQCLPEKEEINGCEGVHPKSIASYLFEVGLVEEFTTCDSIDSSKAYRFSTIFPESPNAGGVMNLVAEGKPVFTMVALDLMRLHYVKDMSNSANPIKCGGYDPSLYGIITGYKYDEFMIEDSYWELTSYIVPCEKTIIRFPMSANMTNGNYGGIAAYAFTLELLDSPSEIPTTPLITSFVCNENIYPTIESIPDYATELIFEENSYSEVTTVDFTRFTQLHTLTINKGAFSNCYSVRINNPKEKIITIGDNCFTGTVPSAEARRLADSLAVFVIANAANLESLTIGNGSLSNIVEMKIENVNGTANVNIGSGSLSNIESFVVVSSGNSEAIGSIIADAIITANPGKTIDITVTTPIPVTTLPPITELPTTLLPTTLPPTTLPPTTLLPTTQAPTTQPPTTQPPTTLPPTTLLPTTLPPTTIPPTTIPPTTIPPTTLPPTTLPPTTIPPTIITPGEPLVIESDSDCSKLLQTNWQSITVNEGLCNSMTGSLTISEYPNLMSISIALNSLKSITSLTISHNPYLYSFDIQDGNSPENCALYAVTTFVMEDLPQIRTITIGANAMSSVSQFNLANFPLLTSFASHIGSFTNTVLSMSNLPQLSSLSIGTYCYSTMTNITISDLPKLNYLQMETEAFNGVTEVHIRDLPNLGTIDLVDGVFSNAISASFENLPKLSSFILGINCFPLTKNLTIYNVPFEDGYYDVADYGPEIISFHDLTVDGIISDSISSNLVNAIISHLPSASNE